MTNNLVKLKKAVALAGAKDVMVEVCTITPATATEWLKANNHNRPLSPQHVNFITKEIVSGNWQLNGQAIIVSDDENVLDGQHRLHAIIKAGIAIKTIVIYGIQKEAFKTIDTGKKRTGSDALSLEYVDAPVSVTNAVATAARFCIAYESRVADQRGIRISNTTTLKYVAENPMLWRCAETVHSFNKDSRPLSVGAGAGLYYLFNKRDSSTAEKFIRELYTGEELKLKSPTYVCREMLLRDARRAVKWPVGIRARLVIKTWNHVRAGKTSISQDQLRVRIEEEAYIPIK